jgi:hypothetical protein
MTTKIKKVASKSIPKKIVAKANPKKKAPAKKKARNKKEGANPEGAPKKELDYEILKELCALQCTSEECAAALGVSSDTLTLRLKEDHDKSFPEFFRIHRATGLTSLRRKQFTVASAGDTKMLIHLGKHWLAQIDKTIVDNLSTDGSMSPTKIRRVIVDPVSGDEEVIADGADK